MARPPGAQVVVEPHEREALRGHEVRERLASFGDDDQQRCVPFRHPGAPAAGRSHACSLSCKWGDSTFGWLAGRKTKVDTAAL